MKNNAPAFTINDTSFAACDSARSLMLGLTYCRQILRVKRFAAAIDMIDAGTNAPIAIAANANPTNHDGNICRNSPGTTHCAPYGACGWIPAANPMKPSNAINPNKKLYAGNSAALRLITVRLLELSTPVM